MLTVAKPNVPPKRSDGILEGESFQRSFGAFAVNCTFPISFRCPRGPRSELRCLAHTALPRGKGAFHADVAVAPTLRLREL